MFIYVITNLGTGKTYIGQHKGANLKQYLQKKLWYSRTQKKGSSHLFNAMRKYPDYHDWSIEPLFEGIETREELNRLETILIALYDTRNPEVGYNICRGGEGFTGTHSMETRKKISRASKEMWTRPDIRELIPTANRGRKRVGEALENVQAAAKLRIGTHPSPLTVQRLITSHIGTQRSQESRENQRQSVTGSGNHFYGKKHKSDVVIKMSKQVRCLDTGEVFSSLAEAAKWAGWLGGGPGNMSRALKSTGNFMGRQFEYVQQLSDACVGGFHVRP